MYNTLSEDVLTEDRFIVQKFMIFPGRYIYPNSRDDEDREFCENCSQQINATMKNFIFKMIMIFSSVIVALIWPSYQYLSHGIKTTATQVKFPFIAGNSNAEFIGNFIFQLIVIGHGFAGYIGLEVAMETLFQLLKCWIINVKRSHCASVKHSLGM